MNIDPRQVPAAAQAGVKLLSLESTLIPGNIKAQVVVLESVLMGIGSGSLVVVPRPENVVKSDLDNDESDQKGQDDGDDKTDTGSEQKEARSGSES